MSYETGPEQMDENKKDQNSSASEYVKKGFLSKMFQVGGSTTLSRALGMTRDFLLARYLGAGAISDVFIMAYSIPNSFRKIFAEGALSAAFIPTIVKVVNKDGKGSANRLMTISFIFFEGIVLLLCYLAMRYAARVVGIIAPGFSPEQIKMTIPYLRILMPFIFFVSSSSLLSGALNAVHHFFIPAFSPVLLNIVFIGSLSTCIYFSLPIDFLCYSILFGGFLQFFAHIFVYFKNNFSFEWFDKKAIDNFVSVLAKFGPCLFAMGILEVNFFVDRIFASYLPEGSISLLYYASAFMRIPLGVFGVAFATIVFPYFSKVSMEGPKRLEYYLFESTKFIFWIMIPIAFLMMFFSKDIFFTFYKSKFTLLQISEAATILIVLLFGLFFFSINKVLLNIYYSLHSTVIPAVVSVVGTIVNVFLNLVLIYFFNATGLALATSLSTGLFQTAIFFYFLKRRLNIDFDFNRYLIFLRKFLLQLFVHAVLFLSIYYLCFYAIELYLASWSAFLLNSYGLWLWVAPLCTALSLMFWFTRKLFGIKIHFIN